MQLGYTQEFSESFDSYEVTVNGDDPIYFFLRPEIGIRNKFKNKLNGFNLGYELGVFYRYNLNGLGRAEFLEPDYLTIVQPKGDIIGMYFNIVFPVGRQKMKIEVDNKKSDKKIISRPSFE